MSKLVWHTVGDRLYELGVKKGVLYTQNANGTYNAGVVWNGLTGVTEKPDGAEANPMYADDIKYAAPRTKEDFKATIEAFTYPDEFASCCGEEEIAPGVVVGQQKHKPFGMTYRTTIGNDTEDYSHGYKLHIVYGATECNIMTHCGLKTYIKNLTTNYRSTLGKPFNGVTLKIDDDDNILVSCTALIKGFINDERKYDRRKIDWYNTNDKGFIEDGVLYYRGKYNYFITYKGERYYNHEIEQYITVSCPEIKKCAIVQKRNRITLFLTENVDEAKVSTILSKKYDFKVKYRYIPAIPHDTRHHTKTDYKQLLKIA